MALHRNKAKDTSKERMIKGVALNEDELEMVNGGEILKMRISCPLCGQSILEELYESHCAVCGKGDSNPLAGTML